MPMHAFGFSLPVLHYFSFAPKEASAKCTERRKQMRNQNKHSEKSNVEIRTNIRKIKGTQKKLFKKSSDFSNSFFLRSIYSNVLFRNVTI